MKTPGKSAVAALAAMAMTGQSLAADICARPEEAMALKAAAVQQELMVAALTCGDIQPYNQFVLSHRRELQESDAALLSYFQRAASREAGMANYNAYKTGLANNFSLASLRRRDAFCYTAETAFAESGRPLAMFVSDQQVASGDFSTCSSGDSDMVAGGSSALRGE
ncbi:MAG TPA: hypothetical protein VGG48_14785 [Rhizomicrobium sp.]|jgi:hypothetical protein